MPLTTINDDAVQVRDGAVPVQDGADREQDTGALVQDAGGLVQDDVDPEQVVPDDGARERDGADQGAVAHLDVVPRQMPAART